MLVLKFGVRKILSGADSAHAEMRTAHQLFNALVSIERWKRREYSATRSRYVPGLAEAESAYEQLSDWIGEHSGREASERSNIREKRRRVVAQGGAPTKRVDDDEERDAIAELKACRREAGAFAKPLREQFAALVTPAEDEYRRRTSAALKGDNHAKKRLNASAREAMLSESEWHDAWKAVALVEATAYELRAWVGDAHTLNHGTYLATQDDVVRAGKRPPPRPDGEPRKPRQRPAYSTKGLRKMGWQLTPGTTWADVLAGKCRDLRVLEMRPVGGSGHRWRATFEIRISTAERGVYNWVVLDVVVHRPIPEDTRVAWVYLVPEERPQGRWEYSVQLTAAPTEPFVKRATGPVGSHVHVELCWTQIADTLQVARINGAPLLLPAGDRGVVARLRFAEHLRGVADRYFDEARDETVKRVAGLPPHVQRMCETLPHWRSHRKLVSVAAALVATLPHGLALETWRAWQAHRIPRRLDLHAPIVEYIAWLDGRGVDAGHMFALWLDLWRHKSEHLERMGDGTRRRAMGARRELYRVTAARFSEQYETCSLGGAVDLAALALRDKSEDHPAELHQAARHNRTHAAVSEFKDALKHAFGPDRMRERSAP